MITPAILFFGTIGFIISFVSHIIIWRVIRPAKHMVWLAVIFIILPIVVYILMGCLGYRGLDCKNVIFVLLWHLALSAAYIMSYPAIQAECPTLKIILAVRDSMPKGMRVKAINDIFCNDRLLSDRFDDLINDDLISRKDGKWSLSLKGSLLVSFFSIYRKLLGLPLGEG